MNYKKYTVITGIPTGESEATEWIQWHIQLKKRFGKKKANLIWTKAWRLRAGKGSSASTVDLRKYMGKQGVDLDTTTLEGISDTVSGIGDFFGDILTVGMWTGIVIGGVLLIGIGVAVYQIVRNPQKSAQTVATIRGGGYR